MSKYTTKTFDNINQAEAIIASLPMAEARTIHTSKISPEKEDKKFEMPEEVNLMKLNRSPETDKIGIVNKETGELAAIASEKYDLIQHREAFFPIIQALKDLDLDIKGRVAVVDSGNYVNVEARIKGEEFNIPNDSEYMQGFFFRNSFDTSSSVGVEAFYERVVCSNGMVMQKNVISPMKRRHIGNTDLVERYKEWFEELLENSKRLKARLEMSRDEYVYVKRSLHSIDMPKTKVKEIEKRIESEYEEDETTVSKKEVYDAITNWITEEVQGEVSESTFLRYQKKAEELLFSDTDKLNKKIAAEVDY